MARGLRGIADLRTGDDLYLSNRDDWAFARRLNDDFDRLDFRGLLERYFDLDSEIPPDLRRRQIAHIVSAPERARRWLETLGSIGTRPMLDLGCGTGSFLAAVGHEVGPAWGLDIALRWLLVARKRLDEEGLTHVRLACGCAERLPFRDRSFGGVVAGDVIEHVADQDRTLAEAHRVLAPGGRLFLAVPNRFSLAPEPHVQVWGVGFLPRRWMAPYVRLVRRLDFRAIRTLSHGEWTRLLRRSPFGWGTITAPGLPAADLLQFGPFKRQAARLYNALIARGPGQAVARRVGPLFHVVCERPEEGGTPSTIPATRRRSTPTAAPR
jgi:SAM-dependent methyltransferase